MGNRGFDVKIKYEGIPILDSNFKSIKDLDLTMKDIKKKFE